ncbi:MAG: hypothetical protein HY821_01160 [Acidobacteria bacterium]|nr:hypothetical protein [Acidobacteriota bacterium]
MDRNLIERHLTDILSSPDFSSSKRCQDFLRFVVTESLTGRSIAIKERIIGTAVFERGEHYDPSEDSIVRVKAVEVRKRLAQYYEHNTPAHLVIELPSGTYVPTFREVAPPRPATVPPASPRVWWHWAASAALLLLAAAGFYRLRTPPPDDLDLLWRPIATQTRPVLIAVPSPAVSVLVNQTTREHIEWKARRRPTPPTLRLEDLRLREHHWVGVGATTGAARFAGVLGRLGKPFELRINPDISFSDLRNQPVLLLGAFSAPWSMEMTRGLRFELRGTVDGPDNAIVDTGPSGRTWRLQAYAAESIAEDYALVSRVFESKSGQMAILAAGFSPPGTQAAAEFLTDPVLFRQFTSQAPPDWASRNFQIVLHCTVHAHTPGPPKVIATHVW